MTIQEAAQLAVKNRWEDSPLAASNDNEAMRIGDIKKVMDRCYILGFIEGADFQKKHRLPFWKRLLGESS